jgi:pyrimidine-specific ribonucleoside hydrolase
VKKILFFALYVTFSVFNISAQDAKVIYFPVIIDTDCAPDDLRAICLLAAIKEVDILAITTSDGALAPGEGVVKVNQLLTHIRPERIPIAAGRKLKTPPPTWREYCKKIPWGTVKNTGNLTDLDAAGLIADILNKSAEPVLFICLGSLTNLYDLLKQSPGIGKKLKKVIWYNDEINPPAGSNYIRDKLAADSILATNLNIVIISGLNKNEADFNNTLLDTIERITNPYAKSIAESHRIPVVYEKITNGHLQIWDDLIPVYLLYPELFDMEPVFNKPNISINIDYSPEEAKRKMLGIITQKYSLEKNIVFENFPSDKEFFRSDVKEYMDEIINTNGKEEWRICVLTNEIHGHLGIYSIIGAKMGLKAREIFNVGVDQLKVLSYAGDNPPLSCMNDGLQISTGATLGEGEITIFNDSIFQPEALFIYKNQKIKIRLKKEYRERIEDDISQGILQYGNLTSGYWKLIRKLGLKYWAEWSRNKIFDIE